MKYLCLSIGILIMVLVAGTIIALVIKPPTWTLERMLLWPVLILAGACGTAFIINAFRWNDHPE